MKGTLRGNIIAGYGSIVLLLLLSSGLSYRSTRGLSETAQWVAHTYEVLGQLTTVLTLVDEIETGTRGYLLSGEKHYLDPYNTARGMLEGELTELRRLMVENPQQQQRLDRLEPLIAQKLALVSDQIDLRPHQGSDSAALLGLVGKGKAVMDAIRTVIEAAVSEEREAVQRHEAAASTSAHTTMVILVGFSLLAVGFVACAGVHVTGEFRAREQAEHAFRQSEELYHTLATNFPNGMIYLFDHDLRYTIAEGAGLAAIGLSHETLQGKTIGEVWPAEICATIEPRYRAALAGTASVAEVVYADHTYFVHTLPVTDKHGAIFAGISMTQDITARKKVEQLKNEFVATVSHELRTPLTSLRGFAELILHQDLPPRPSASLSPSSTQKRSV